MVEAATAIGQSEPFRHNALAAQGAGVPEDDLADAVEVLVEGDTVAGVAEKDRQRVLSTPPRLLAG